MKAYMIKLPGGLLRPDDEESAEAIKKLPPGTPIAVEWKQPRNYRFHKKFFAMLKVGFDAWEPTEIEHKGHPVQKNFDRFREDVIIAAGFGEIVYNIRGEARARAKSISFSSMTEEEFEKLYNAAADVLLKNILHNYKREDLDAVIQELTGFIS